jgi:hypothetical protein
MASLLIMIGGTFIFVAIIMLIAITAGLVTMLNYAIVSFAPFVLLPVGFVFLLLGLKLAGKLSWGLKHTKA